MASPAPQVGLVQWSSARAWRVLLLLDGLAPRAVAHEVPWTATRSSAGAPHPAEQDSARYRAYGPGQPPDRRGLRAGDVDRDRALLQVSRQTYPAGRSGDQADQGPASQHRARHRAPEAPLARLTVGRDPEERLLTGPRGEVITTATLRDATGGDQFVAELGLPAWSATDSGTRP